MRDPLAPPVFLVRNASKSAPLVGVIVLAVLLVTGIVSIMDSIPLSIRTTYGASRAYLGLTPRGNNAMTPVLRRVVEKEAPVPLADVMVCRASETEVKSIVGPWRFVVLALSPQDMHRYVDRLGGGKVNGRWPEQDRPEALVSRPVAQNLGKRIGDTLLKPDDPNAYSPQEVKIVGIVESSEWLMLVPIDYHRKNHFPPIDLLIVMSERLQDQDKLDRWAFERFKGEQARVYANFLLERETDEMFRILYSILNVVIGMLVVVITLMMGMLMNIYQSQRVQEFGLLQAIGHSQRALLRRVVAESLMVVFGGWLLGLACSVGLLLIVKKSLMDPRAFMLDPFSISAIAYTTPVPVAILAVAIFTVWSRFRKVDPVAIVERRLV